jgi:hypothetical protein
MFHFTTLYDFRAARGFCPTWVDLTMVEETLQRKSSDGEAVTEFMCWTKNGIIDLHNPILSGTKKVEPTSTLLPDGMCLSQSSVIQVHHVATGMDVLWQITEMSQTVMEAANLCSKVFISSFVSRHPETGIDSPPHSRPGWEFIKQIAMVSFILLGSTKIPWDIGPTTDITNED